MFLDRRIYDVSVVAYPIRQIAARISELVIFGLEDDYHRTYRDRIRAITPEQVAEAGLRQVRPSEVQVVVVGDAESVVSPLEGLDVGPVEVVSPRG